MTPAAGAEETVLAEQRGDLFQITLNRPASLNAFGGEMRERLAHALRRATESDARVVLLTGAGRAFCAGADVHTLHRLVLAGDSETFERNLRAGAEVVRLLATMELPTVAVLNGVAAGAGASLACACDLRVAARRAAITFSFVRIGLHPDWGATYHLPRLVGAATALDLLLSARVLKMSEARRLRLVDRVAPDDRFLSAADHLAASLRAGPRRAVALARRSLGPRLAGSTGLEAALNREIEAQLECFRSDDLRRRLSEFLLSNHPSSRVDRH